ncbi:MAG: hypothetical protein ACM31D_09185 [Bacteroidota bacterium]
MTRLPVIALALWLAACQAPAPGFPDAPEPLASAQPLERLTRTRIPPSARTVEQAASWLLEPSGYHLVLVCDGCPSEAVEIGRKPVSPLGLKPQITTIKRALVLVAGSEVRLLVDDKSRLVSFGYQPMPGRVMREDRGQ